MHVRQCRIFPGDVNAPQPVLMMQVPREGRWGHHRSGHFITIKLPMHLLYTYTH